jgi:hypothetical protein
MNYQLDHIVVAARSLEEGAVLLRDQLGVEPEAGGKHASVGTHNTLIGLQNRAYLEVIAIDPDAPAPSRVRWYGLDEAAVRSALETGPKMIAYVVRCDAMPQGLRMFPKLDPQSVARGDLRWTFGFTADGRRPGMGALPYFIAWDASSAHPCDRLTATPWAIDTIDIALPCAPAVQMTLEPLGLDAIVKCVDAPAFALSVVLRNGSRTVRLS